MTSFEAAAAELYRLPPEDFTARRNARGKELREGDKQLAERVSGLTKPALPAWAVNLFAHEQPDALGDLLDLGAELREAQEQLARDRLRELTAQAHQVVQDVVAAVGRVAADAGHRLSDTAQAQVEQTLRAAMSDADASDAVRAGLLAKPLAPGGFGAVDLTGAVAGAPPHVPARRRAAPTTAPDDTARKEAERAVQAAEDAERDADAEVRARESALDQADQARRAADEDVARLREELTHAEQAATDAGRHVRLARQAHDKAVKHLDAARRRTEEARRALEG